ncbi:hypothetical protein CO661_00390 [Sinorhizobium fredii]|uniref:Uncharacterized protein n=1 Tax=Rhizobium fredii TaxID=380 RepID=A0A2A6M6H7_RHIFR|nr:hypothetical protein [Sinorhizobium fredii]PDT50160.1 hypothetical protein CO661_00390 [Sinorhizobium fredii]
MQYRDTITPELEGEERLDREWENRLGAVREAMEAVAWAWTILATEIQRFGYSAERPVPENASFYSYFDAIEWEAREMSDSIYWSFSTEEREKDDRDLEEFEATYFLRKDYSRRIKALAFLTAGKSLICSIDEA